MRKIPLVSIIIPTYNRANLIGDTILSIKNQSFTNWECIIVDDGSTDDTESKISKILKDDERFFYYDRPKELTKGANSCRNYGFSVSKGKYINWFDSDDIMHPDKLLIQIKHLEKDNSFPFTVCQTLLFKNTIDNTFGLRNESIFSNNFFEDFICNRIKWLTQSPLIRKAFLVKNNLFFDESLHQSQERDFFIKVLNLVDKYHIDNTPLVYFRVHNNSISSGKVTKEKLLSNFQVNYSVLTNYSDKISQETKNILLSGLKQTLLRAIKIKDKELQMVFLKKIYSKLDTLQKKIKFIIGYSLIKITNKGYFLYK